MYATNNTNSDLETKRKESERYLESTGRKNNGYGTYEDPDKPWRTAAHIDSNGHINYDM